MYEIFIALWRTSGQYRSNDLPSCHFDLSGTAVNWALDEAPLRVLALGRWDGFKCIWCLWISLLQRRIKRSQIFDAALNDFSVKVLEWCMPHADFRMRRIWKMTAKTGLVVLSPGSKPTFLYLAWEWSIPHVTFASETLRSLVDEWRALEDFSASVQQYTAFEVVDHIYRRAPARRERFFEALGIGSA